MAGSRRRLVLCLILLCVPLLLVGPVGRYLVVVPLVLFVPGYLLERALRFPVPIPWIVRPALWLGGSISIVPVIYAWTWLFGLHLFVPALVIMLGGCVLVACWLLWHDDTSEQSAVGISQQDAVYEHSSGAANLRTALVGAAIAVLTLARRFYEIRNDALPLWVDSVHHALLIRVAAEQGTIPLDVRPYLPVSELPYHWGFHVVVGTILQLTGLDLPRTLLWSGQIVNALQVLAVAALAAYFWRSSVAGLVAAAVVGLVSLMPAYLVTWGRYTLLEGLLILSPLVIAALAGMRSNGWRPWAMAALLTGGVLLTHYIVSVFALTLLSLLFVWHLAADGQRPILEALFMNPLMNPLRTRRGAKRIWNIADRYVGSSVRYAVKSALCLGLALVSGALLATPWLLVLARRIFVRYVQSPNELRGGGSYNALVEGLLWAGQNRLLFTLAAFALLLSIWRRRSPGLYLAAWPLLLLFIANPNIVGLPVLWLVTNTEVLVSLYIPAAALIGGGVALVWGMLAADRKPQTAGHEPNNRRFGLSAGQWVLLAVLVLGVFAGERNLGDVINPTTRIAGAADVEAINWIAANTPPDARILTAASGWLPDAERGADGGWWVVPLAGRWSSTPPVLFTYAAPADVAAIQARTRTLANLKAGEEAATLARIIEQNQIGYIYVGASPTSFKAAWFDGDPRYERVYDHDGIVIFARRS